MTQLRNLPRICVALGCVETAELRRWVLDVCEQGEEFLEIRLDMLHRPESGIAIVRRVLRRYPQTVILATSRRRANGGHFHGTIEQQVDILNQAIRAGATLVDVEVETAEAAPALTGRLREKALVIVSYHNFTSTPALPHIVRRLQKRSADLYKIATTARKPSDNLRILNVPQMYPDTPLVVMAMGDVGAPSRILGPARHSVFTYAAPDPRPVRTRSKPPAVQPTAPGQITSSILRNRYRAHIQQATAKVYGVVAWPVGHSMSPAMHNRAFQARRVDAVYLPFQVEPTKLSDFFQLAKKLPIAGFSVTIPHKQRVIRHLDSVDRLARRIGAVNTVLRKRGKLYGTNTDAAGVTVPLSKKVALNKASVLVAGNGGAARAAIFALTDQGARVTVTGRNPQRVRKFARACGVRAVEREKLKDSHFDVLIHATPVGMYPKVNECFFEDSIPADLVFDMVYNPLQTALLKKAQSAGKETISGLEMFLEQAFAQFETWTGEAAPRIAMRNAVLEALGAS